MGMFGWVVGGVFSVSDFGGLGFEEVGLRFEEEIDLRKLEEMLPKKVSHTKLNPQNYKIKLPGTNQKGSTYPLPSAWHIGITVGTEWSDL